MKKHFAVIVLGLGEAAPLYRFVTRNWERRFGITPIIHVVGWKTTAPFETKLSALMTRVEQLSSQGNVVSLVGFSAGASIALHTYARLRQKGVNLQTYASICGRFNFIAHPWYPQSYGVDRIPSFKESVKKVAETRTLLTRLSGGRMASFSSIFDEVVPISASTLPRAKKHTIPFLFHTPSIFFLFLWPKRLVACIK
jgi:hypothetical protein